MANAVASDGSTTALRPVRAPTAMPLVVLVVGNGMVSHRFCEKMTEYGMGQYRLVVVGEEPHPAYDRVNLTSYFAQRSADALLLGTREWYEQNGIELRLSTRVVRVDCAGRQAFTRDDEILKYDVLVLATGSAPFVPPVPGIDRRGVFVYRTIEDLECILEHSKAARRAAVIGGGLLGLEAARAVLDAGLETHVIEVAPRLMPRQLDAAGSALLEATIRAQGIYVHLDKRITSIGGSESVETVEFSDGGSVDVDVVIVSAGIRPRDELAREAGIAVGERGGVLVDNRLRTSASNVYAIGEVALHDGMIYGLVAPGYDMAAALARNLTGQDAEFRGGDLSAKLKLLGTDVATFGDPFLDPTKVSTIVYEDRYKGIYKKLVLRKDGSELLGGMLVGDASQYGTLLAATRSKTALPDSPAELILGRSASGALGAIADEAQVCSCNNVTKKTICAGIRESALTTIGQVKSCTKAGTGCGGCLPLVTDILNAELKAAGKAVKPRLCEHFAYTRQELFEIVAVKRISTFDSLLKEYGRGYGCEICKPAVASILASVHNDFVLKEEHATLQDTNDRFLANIQRSGLYSVVPRIPGGEITPDKLIALGQVAKKYDLYMKITGGQRIDLFGARVENLPDIWEELVNAGFESGHAYGKAVRTVKSCVGSTWCRYGVQDSVAFAILIENRYKGIRAPHKLKSAVSGCVRECAEAQSKDFGIIATEKGWNVYVCGNGGMKPRHADLLAADVDSETAIRYLDRFLMFYIRTADRLTRTSVWLERMEGGIDHLRNVVCNDSLRIAEQLEKEMQKLVDTYTCEWAEVVGDPVKRSKFRHFANSPDGDSAIRLVAERGQHRPVDWDKQPMQPELGNVRRLPVAHRSWVRVACTDNVPKDGGISIKYGGVQIAVFNFASRGEWYATQNMCPHRQDMVLARGIVGDQAGRPKVACPLHKKTFALDSGECLSGEPYQIATFPVRIDGQDVLVELPPVAELEQGLCKRYPDGTTEAVAS
jgi:NAD(P)H-dependent nitrite reductase large subunit/NAD(P)H-dependent nitrite reductase small subunit